MASDGINLYDVARKIEKIIRKIGGWVQKLMGRFGTGDSW